MAIFTALSVVTSVATSVAISITITVAHGPWLYQWLYLWLTYRPSGQITEKAQRPGVNSSMCGDKNEACTNYGEAATLIPVNNNVLLFRLLDIFLLILIDRLVRYKCGIDSMCAA